MDLLVNIDVDDLNKAVDFYSAAFGLKARPRFGELGVELAGGSVAIFLLVKGGHRGRERDGAEAQLRTPLDSGAPRLRCRRHRGCRAPRR